MDKLRVLKHYAYQEVTADLLNSIADSLFTMQDGMAQSFIAGFQNTDHLIFFDLDVTPDVGLAVKCGLQGVFMYRTGPEDCMVGVYKGTRPDKNTPYAEESFTLTSADLTNPRIDIIEAEIVDEDDPDYFDTVQLFNQTTETSYAQNKNIRRVRNVKLYIKDGTPDPSPVAPIATAGRFTLREIYVAANAVTIGQPDIIEQTFDPELTNWTTAHGVIQFPSIYEMIQYIKTELSQARRTIFAQAGTYQFIVPLFRNQVYIRMASGGGGGGGAASVINTNPYGENGEASEVVGVVRVAGSAAGGASSGVERPGLSANNILHTLDETSPLDWGADGEKSEGVAGGIGGRGGAIMRSGARGGYAFRVSLNSLLFECFDDNGRMYFKDPDILPSAGVATFDPKYRFKVFHAGDVNLEYNGRLSFISGQMYVLKAARISKLIGYGDEPVYLCGDPAGLDSDIIDGVQGVGRVSAPGGTAKSIFLADPENPGWAVFTDHKFGVGFPPYNMFIRRVNLTTGELITDCQIAGVLVGTDDFDFLMIDPIVPNSILGVRTSAGPHAMCRVDRATGAVTDITTFAAPGSATGAIAATTFYVVIAPYYDSVQDRLYWFDLTATSSGILRFFTQFSTLAGISNNGGAFTSNNEPIANGIVNTVVNKAYIVSTVSLGGGQYCRDIYEFDIVLETFRRVAAGIRDPLAAYSIPFRISGVHGGGGGGASPINPAFFPGPGGAANMIEGTFSVTPASVLTVIVGAGGKGALAIPNIGVPETTAGGSGGDGFVEISW